MSTPNRSVRMKVLLAALACAAAVAVASPIAPRSSARDPRFFFVFTVPASQCQTGVTTYPAGTCYSAADCQRLGGTASLPCENNLGVCCYFRKTCGQVITRDRTLFTNQNYPNSNNVASTCTASVQLQTTNICQLKLEFVVFELLNTTSTAGVCSTDHLQIVGSTTPNTPLFCGTRTGQTINVDVNRLGVNPLLRVTLGASTVNRRWSIRVTQIPCNGAIVTGITFPAPPTTTTNTTTTTSPTNTGIRCVSTSSISPMGTCYPTANCSAHGGKAAGNCPNSQVCCIFVKTCGETIDRNMTSFVSTNYPAFTNTAATCTATVKRIGSSICQLKLDFTNFELQPASADSSCLVDSLEVVGSTTPLTPKFCGVRTGQTQYLNISSTGPDPQLKITTGSASTASRRWNVNVTQIFCNSTQLGQASFSVPPTTCSTGTALSPSGTCYSAANCTALGGKASGTCADGNGVCCYFTQMCGGTITANETNFVNNGFSGFDQSGTTATMCAAKIKILDANICQLRLDFDDFEIAQPDGSGSGVCSRDFFEVTGTTSTSIPRICGQNKGQHMILDVTGSSTPEMKFTLGITPATTIFRKWNVKVTQIYCNSTLRAPSGCLQYFTEATGEVKSFNFKQASRADIKGATAPAVSPPINLHLASQNYQVCVRAAAGQCKIEWKPPAAPALPDPTTFLMSGDGTADPFNGRIGGNNAIRSGAACPLDFVRITGGTFTGNTPVVTSDRFCGGHLKAIMSSTMPFTLGVVTSADEGPTATPDRRNTGFHLAYTQSSTACTGSG